MKWTWIHHKCILQTLGKPLKKVKKKKYNWGFPGGLVVKNPPANAADSGWIPPCSGDIPHAEEQLSLCATTTEPVL